MTLEWLIADFQVVAHNYKPAVLHMFLWALPGCDATNFVWTLKCEDVHDLHAAPWITESVVAFILLFEVCNALVLLVSVLCLTTRTRLTT